MPYQELTREYPYSTKSAEIKPLQVSTEIQLAPGVGRNSLLEKTAFDTVAEMTRLLKNYNQNLSQGLSHTDALLLSVSETEINIRTFIVEYIQSGTVVPHVSRLEEKDGSIRMVGQNGVPVVDGITREERSGATLLASVIAESFLTEDGTKMAPNKVAVINSPIGHSGRINKQGKRIKYKVNQTIVSYTDEAGDLHTVTLVSDLNQDQSRKLSISLGVEEDLLGGITEAEQVANIVQNPALFSHGRSITNPVQYVLDKMVEIRGDSDFRLEQDDGTVEIRSVAKTRRDIENHQALLKFNPVWENFLKQLKDLILAEGADLSLPFVQHLIAKEIEKPILDITIDHLEKTKPELFNTLPDNVIFFNSEAKVHYEGDMNMARYAIAAQFLETRSGCNSGEESSEISLSGSSSGSSTSSWGSSSESKRGRCKKCGRSKRDGHYHCLTPGCLVTHANETKVAAEKRTKSCSCGFKFECGAPKKKENKESKAA